MPVVSVHKKQEHYEVHVNDHFIRSCDSSELREAIADSLCYYLTGSWLS